jgi:uncharacterized protein with NRDE domain
MCLVLFSYKNHPEYPLLIAANRDEFYARPTEPAGFWPENKQILAGRDLLGGGTWMGVSRKGKVALLTNYRDLKNIRENAPSRGDLVKDFLLNDMEASAYLQEIRDKGKEYNGFNLICGELQGDLFYYGNYQEDIRQIEPGVHGLSNALLDTPWPKVEKGKQKLEEVMNRDRLKENMLFDVLYDDVKAPREVLPDTGVGMQMEEMLSPIFIKSPDYGSRCSTVVMVEKNGNVTFAERTYDLVTYQAVTRTFLFGV